LSFLNAKDKEIIRDHLLDARERIDQALGILSRDVPAKASTPPSRSKDIPDGAWKMHPASDKQLATLEQFKVQFNPATLTKGEAADIIKGLFARRDT